MTWIRFGRNEPRAPSVLMQGNGSGDVDLHRFRRDGTLLLFFTPAGGLEACPELFAMLHELRLREQEAEFLVVTTEESDLAGDYEVAIAHDRAGTLRRQYAGLMATESAGKPMLFVLDRDGSPVYAWVGACDEGPQTGPALIQKLQSAGFLCPECSVPDPASVTLWDVVY